MNQLLVSFVIPVFNSEYYIKRCLLSIQNLDFSKDKYEVLIIDNGSTDQTHQIIHDLGFDFQVVPKVNVSTLRNLGASMAQGKYVAFIDSDVELSPCWLQNALEGFNDPQVVACGCFPAPPKNPTWVQQTWDLHQRRCSIEVKPRPISWLPSMNLIVRRSDFLAISGFNEILETAEDVDMCYRIERRGTILLNPRMQATHWGEARDLKTFWRKEVWRGLGNIKGILSHGFRRDELPSLGYPLYIMGMSTFLVLTIFIDLWQQQLLFSPLCLFLLSLPALCLALNTAYLTNSFFRTPQLFTLYLIYGLSRAYSVVKAWKTISG